MNAPAIPDVLKRKLVFGDEEQISAVRDYERKCSEYFGGEGERRWAVTVEAEVSAVVYVTGKNKKEAEEKAREEFDLSLSDFDVFFSAKEAPETKQ